MNDYNLTPHLTYREATYSITAARNGIVNIPNPSQLANIQVFANTVFETLRALVGTAIHVDVIFRSPGLNTFEDGVSNSQHLANGGSAAGDLDNNNYSDCAQNDVLFMTSYNHLQVDFDQLIAEDITEVGQIGWIHISHDCQKDKQRRESMVSFFANKERVYRMFDPLKGFVRSKYLNEDEV